MKKGFTLIELLAVIVILAIIALIATPIILGIINDAREDANKRSVENYAHAVELAIARDATKKGGVIETGTYTIDFESKGKKIISPSDNPIEVDYKGEAITDGTIIVLSEEGKEGQIELSEISFDGGKIKYNYSHKNGVQRVKEKEISEEKDLTAVFYQYNTMYDETQPGLIESALVDDFNNDKKLDINQELSAFLQYPIFNIPTTEFTVAVPATGNIKAVITHYDGTEEEITLTTTDDKIWTYKYTYESIGKMEECEFEFRPYTRLNTSYSRNYIQSNNSHLLDLDCYNWVPFAKITILGKTIEFPVNKKAAVVIGNMATEEMGTMFTDINKVSKVVVNFKNGEKKEYSRNQMYDADKYLGDSNDYCPSEGVPILYYNFSAPVASAFVIYMPYPEIKDSLESVIVEENGILTKYNVTDSTVIQHGVTGS